MWRRQPPGSWLYPLSSTPQKSRSGHGPRVINGEATAALQFARSLNKDAAENATSCLIVFSLVYRRRDPASMSATNINLATLFNLSAAQFKFPHGEILNGPIHSPHHSVGGPQRHTLAHSHTVASFFANLSLWSELTTLPQRFRNIAHRGDISRLELKPGKKGHVIFSARCPKSSVR